MKILVTGVNGLVGNSIIKLLSNTQHEVFKSSRRVEGLADHKVDITLKNDLDLFFSKFEPDIFKTKFFPIFLFFFEGSVVGTASSKARVYGC